MASGDCYEAAGNLMMGRWMRGTVDRCLLVHGEVAGQGPLEGTSFGHAWVEEGNTVFDYSNGKQVVMPKVVYYALGQIDRIDNLHKHTWEETRAKMLEYGHYGPWDLRTSTGL